MTKKWWLKLFTIPDVKNQVFYSVLDILCFILVYHYKREWEPFVWVIWFLSLFMTSRPTKDSLSSNQAFYQQIIGKGEIRKAMVYDFLIHILFKVLLNVGCFMTGMMLFHRGTHVDSVDMSFSPSYAFIYLTILVAIIGGVRLIPMNNPPAPIVPKQKIPSSRGIVISIAIIFGLYVLFKAIDAFIDYTHSAQLFFVTSLLLCIGVLIFSLFHITDKSKSILGSASAFLMLFCCWLSFTKWELKSDYFDFEAKSLPYSFWGIFSPPLNEEQFIGFIEVDSKGEIYYLKGPKNFRKIPLNKIFKTTNFKGYNGYLKNVIPSNENLLFIASELERFESLESKDYNEVLGKALKIWPHDLKPTRFIAKQFEKKEIRGREIASQKRLKAKERLLDRY